MATIALPRPIPAGHTRSSSPHPLSPPLSIDGINTASSACPIAIPNKHLPVCPPGPAPSEKPDTPPQSPPTKEISLSHSQRSLLWPAINYSSHYIGSSIVYDIDAAGVVAALDHIAGQPLPDPSQVFPWFHGLHPCNHIQQAFFIQRRKALRRTPKYLRGITIVKADGDLDTSRLKGAISPHEFLHFGLRTEFKEVDPKEGFSVRNFQIQTAKCAMVSDIIVYGEDPVGVTKLAKDIAGAQQIIREDHFKQGHEIPHYNTFICTSPFIEFEKKYPQIVSVDSRGCLTGQILDFFHQERMEMCAMTRDSEIDHNVWLGPSPDPLDDQFDISIKCSDFGRLEPLALQAIADGRSEETRLEFPSSGSIMWSEHEADGIVETCRWIYNLAHGILPQEEDDEDSGMTTTIRERKILIHCEDGYTESSLLGLAYFTYATGRSIPQAWLDLHVVKKRNFFAYPMDVTFLTLLAPRLLMESPVHRESSEIHTSKLAREEPEWLKSMDGSLPSRITDYMYLGNLGHANNPHLLRKLGIKQILSVGETATWKDGEVEKWGEDNIMVVQRVQDNGVDPLTEEFGRCLDFIDKGKSNKTATLVHCRVGVSRSATICIAEVMRTMHMSFPRAYCFVRARRLNVIIQPHLRFSYELLKWEEKLKIKEGKGRGRGWRRELEWPEIARNIADMNRPYSRG